LLVPSIDVVIEAFVEDAGADLEEVMGAGGCPSHLLLLNHPFRDDAVQGDLGCPEDTGTMLFGVTGIDPWFRCR
jgi:hypothetical protein